MRTLVHLSDLHFGRIDYALLKPLVTQLEQISPDLIAVSGDLTQRAREREFREARAFLDSLPFPQIVVPGNHDVPLHNVYARFAQPLHLFQRHITANLDPYYEDLEMAVAGVNTARGLTFKNGRINLRQVERLIEWLRSRSGALIRIVVTHHPFDLPQDYGNTHLVGRARMAMERLATSGADVFLAGHMHLSYSGRTAARYKIQGYAALVIQAGTATSTRGRGEFNSFNVLRVDRPHITVERYSWQRSTGHFAISGTDSFVHTAEGWRDRE